MDIKVPGERETGRHDAFDRILAVVAIALLLIGLGVFWVDGFRDRVSSDAAITLLLARHILETGSALPSDWYYGNGDLWILGPQIFSIPFVALWGATPLALACGNALGLLVLFASTYTLASAACSRWPPAVLAATLGISLYSHFQREFVVVQLSYGLMSAKLMLLLGAAIVWLRAARSAPVGQRALMVLIGYALLLGVWSAENPVRPLIYLVLPLGTMLALHPSRASRPTVVLAAATAIALGLGWLSHQWLLGRLQMVSGLEAFRFTPVREWPGHVRLLVAGSTYLYGGDPLGLPPLPILEETLAWLRAACIPAMAILLARGAVARRVDAGDRLLLQVGGTDIAIIAVVLVAGRMLVDPVADRYLIPAWHLGLTGLVIASIPLARWRYVAVLLVIAFPLAGVLNAVGIVRADASTDSAALAHPPPLDDVLTALRSGGARRGFSTHRYANAATVRSNGELELCDVLLIPELRPARAMNAKGCFDPATYADGFFVLLAPDERDETRTTKLRATIGPPQAVVNVGDYEIWAYPKGTGDLGWLSR